MNVSIDEFIRAKTHINEKWETLVKNMNVKPMNVLYNLQTEEGRNQILNEIEKCSDHRKHFKMVFHPDKLGNKFFDIYRVNEVYSKI
jgi:hypothetical protein